MLPNNSYLELVSRCPTVLKIISINDATVYKKLSGDDAVVGSNTNMTTNFDNNSIN